MRTLTEAENKNTADDIHSDRLSDGSRLMFIVIGGIIGIVLIVIISLFAINRPYKYQGSLIDPPLVASDFQIDDQYGQPFALSGQRGKAVIIFFGYTHCPDVCPVTLYQFKQIREQLGKKSDDVKFIFITVDPERDTRERLQTHLTNFDPEILGLTDERDVLEKVWQDYGVAQEKREVNSASGYLVDHTARVYLVDQLGYLRLTYPFGIETEKIFEDLEHMLSE